MFIDIKFNVTITPRNKDATVYNINEFFKKTKLKTLEIRDEFIKYRTFCMVTKLLRLK